MLYTPETLAMAGRANPVLLEGRAPIVQAPQAKALGLTDGQVVNAVAEVRGERLKLILQGSAIDWPAHMRLKAGDKLALRAHVQTNGTWVLQPLPANGPASAQVGNSGQAASAAQAQVQTQSQPLGPLAPPAPAQSAAASTPPTSAYSPLTNPDVAMSLRLSALLARAPDVQAWTHLFQSGAISQLASAMGASLGGGTPALGTAPPSKREWFDWWPALRLSMSNLTPKGVREAMLVNGLSAEALLARGSPAAMQDTKTLLRNMLRRLGPSVAASAVVSEALDDVERSQLEAVQALERRELAFSMVLPFVDADPVTLRFKRARRDNPQDPAVFTVDVHTNNQRLGELWLRTVITPVAPGVDAPARVDMTMWALREDVVLAARAASADLADELDTNGLVMNQLQVFNAPRPSSNQAWQPPEAGSVLDINA
jgi:hypothetical protein